MARTPPGYYLHLIAWAQIGVLIRVYLAELLGSACPSVSWAPCLTSSGSRWGGAYFTDLPSNILGSFLMGLFVSSDVLSNSLKHNLAVEAPMAALPVRSPLQEHLAFQVGLRTGLCGSLTTFASWITQMVLMVVGGKHTTVLHHTQWVEALGGLVVGTLAASASLVVGQHCALMIYHRLNPGAFIPYGSPAPEQNKLEEASKHDLNAAQQQQQQEQYNLRQQSSMRMAGGDRSSFISAVDGGVELRRLRTVSSTREGLMTVVVVEAEDGGVANQQQQQQQWGDGGQRLNSLGSINSRQQGTRTSSLEMASMQQQQRRGSSSLSTPRELQQQQSSSSSIIISPRPYETAEETGGGAAAAAAGGFNGDASAAGAGGAAMGPAVNIIDEVDEVEAPSLGVQQVLVDGFAGLTIAALTGISLWRIIQDATSHSLPGRNDPFSQEWFWWAILFGPLGCYGRYYLSRYNGKLSGDWKWFPLGTFIANIAACVVDYVMKVVPVRVPLERWDVSSAVLLGVVAGVGGCLSTVSTWVVEIQRLMLSFPKTSHGYQYIFISLGTALALGLLVYGIPVWTA